MEIDKVLKLDVSPSRIIYANPCKQTSFLKHASKRNVDLMTFDNEAELIKIKAVFPNARYCTLITELVASWNYPGHRSSRQS